MHVDREMNVWGSGGAHSAYFKKIDEIVLSTPGWLSAYVENVCDFFAGTVVLRLMSVVMTPPAVSSPSESGVTSSSSRSESFSDESAPERMAACTVAPNATASSGLILLHGSFPLK